MKKWEIDAYANTDIWALALIQTLILHSLRGVRRTQTQQEQLVSTWLLTEMPLLRRETFLYFHHSIFWFRQHFSTINISKPHCIFKLLLIEMSIHERRSYVRVSFHISHFGDLSHKGTINFVIDVRGTSSPLFEICLWHRRGEE